MSPSPTSTPQARRPPGPRPPLRSAGRVGVGASPEPPGGGAEEGKSLAAPSTPRSLFSMVPARPSYRTPLPVPFKGPTLCGAVRRKPEGIKGSEKAGPRRKGEKKNSCRGGGGGAKGALARHVTGTRRSSVGHFRWSAAAPLKRGGGKRGRRCCRFFFSAAAESGSARRARAGGEAGRPGRGAGAFAAARAFAALLCASRGTAGARQRRGLLCC